MASQLQTVHLLTTLSWHLVQTPTVAIAMGRLQLRDRYYRSERVVQEDLLTSVNISRHEIDARDTKLGAAITPQIPNLAEDILQTSTMTAIRR